MVVGDVGGGVVVVGGGVLLLFSLFLFLVFVRGPSGSGGLLLFSFSLFLLLVLLFMLAGLAGGRSMRGVSIV